MSEERKGFEAILQNLDNITGDCELGKFISIQAAESSDPKVSENYAIIACDYFERVSDLANSAYHELRAISEKVDSLQ